MSTGRAPTALVSWAHRNTGWQDADAAAWQESVQAFAGLLRDHGVGGRGGRGSDGRTSGRGSRLTGSNPNPLTQCRSARHHGHRRVLDLHFVVGRNVIHEHCSIVDVEITELDFIEVDRPA